MEKFCYKCGKLKKEADALIDGLCRECYLSEHRLIRSPEKLTLRVCTTCNGYQLNNSFHDVMVNPEYEYLEAAKKLVSSETEVLQKSAEGVKYEDFEDSTGVNISFEAEYTSNDTILVKLNAQVEIFDTEEPLIDKTRTVIKIKDTTCEVCNKQKVGYYEALLQIRGEKDISEDKLTKIFNDLQERFRKSYKENRDEFVSKIQREHGGLDLYTSSSNVAKELGRFLKKKYDAEIKETAELIGEDSDGQKNYRVTVLARISN